MANRTFDVEARGLHPIRERLRSKSFFLTPTKARIRAAGQGAQRTAQRAAKPHSADKGTLGRGILFDIDADGLTARIYPLRRITGLASTIEEGRRPGRRPPYTPLKRWMISHGIISDGKGTSKLVRLMQNRIMQSGTRGVGFMAKAAEAAEKVLREGVPKTEQEIHDLWERG